MPRRATEMPVDLVKELASLQCTQTDLADLFHISQAQVSRRLAKEPLKSAWIEGLAEGRVSLRRAIFKSAMSGGASAQKLAAANILDWSEKGQLDAHITAEGPAVFVAEWGKADDTEDD